MYIQGMIKMAMDPAKLGLSKGSAVRLTEIKGSLFG